MKLGVSIDPRSTDKMRECAREAESAGLDAVVCGDSQSMYREVYTTLAILVEHTETPDLGVMATNPVTRHITVTASSIATIDEASDGRAILGMATGDSAVNNTEKKPASLRTLAEAMRSIRELQVEGETEWQGGMSRLNWTDSEVPIYLIAEGKQTLALGGQLADGVVHGGWFTGEQIDWAKSRIELGYDRAGRTDDVDFWTCTACEVADTEEAAIDNLGHILSAIAHIKSYGELDGVPDELTDQFAKLGEEYRSDLHNDYDAPHNADLVDKYGLREFMADNWTAAGPPDRILERIENVKRTGVDGVMLFLRTPDPAETIRRLGEHDIPQRV
jgi:alkanesulfonate monooxygenase SsuD/methylene tetrahydromethanopterin reductase-like flavin-dependent oxidoreductase (luciferase family)